MRGYLMNFGGSGAGKGEIKGGAFVEFCFSPGPATVAMNDAPNVGEANAGALEVTGAVEALKNTE